MRDRLGRRVVTQMTRLAAEHQRLARGDEAVIVLERALQIDPCSEEVARPLMTCYARRGRRADAESVCRRWTQSLAEMLGVAPATEIETLLRELRVPP